MTFTNYCCIIFNMKIDKNNIIVLINILIFALNAILGALQESKTIETGVDVGIVYQHNLYDC